MSRATALAGRYVAYAMVFINDPTAGDPTDEELERVLAGCVRAPRPEDYAPISAEVRAWRAWGLTVAELKELADETPVWAVTRGDLNRIAGRKLTDDEAADAYNAITTGDVADAVSAAVTAVIRDGRYI